MKLIYCGECQDVVSLRDTPRGCACGKSSGAYLADGLHAQISGPCTPLGFDNESFDRALASRPPAAPGVGFRAFVIEQNCRTIEARAVEQAPPRVEAWTLFTIADQVLGSMDASITWMSAPQGSLGGRIPKDLLGTREGIEEVRRVLKLIDYGEYL